jgi:N-acylneuraminate cytidylyltransferase
MEIPVFIFARGGSKGLPGKNIREFNGKPLIAYSIQVAKQLRNISEIFVSTDSDEIADIAIEYGAKVPFKRPTELATDESPEIDSWRHALRFLESSTGTLPNAIISLPTTSPLRRIEDVQRCIDIFQISNADLVLAVCDSKKSPYFNIVKENKDGTISLFDNSKTEVIRRQDSPRIFDITTNCYVASSDYIFQTEHLLTGKVIPVEVDATSAIDIDTQMDFEFAEYIHKRTREYPQA